MCVESIDVGQEGGHDSRHTRTQVLGGQAVEVSKDKDDRWDG